MKYLKTFVLAVLAGISIGLGGLVFLSVDDRVIGAALFTIGLFTVCTFGLNLYTGKVCYSNVIVLFQLTFFFLDSNTGPVTNELV